MAGLNADMQIKQREKLRQSLSLITSTPTQKQVKKKKDLAPCLCVKMTEFSAVQNFSLRTANLNEHIVFDDQLLATMRKIETQTMSLLALSTMKICLPCCGTFLGPKLMLRNKMAHMKCH